MVRLVVSFFIPGNVDAPEGDAFNLLSKAKPKLLGLPRSSKTDSCKSP